MLIIPPPIRGITPDVFPDTLEVLFIADDVIMKFPLPFKILKTTIMNHLCCAGKE